MSLCITATDTDVGKTLVSALLLTRYHDLSPAYWKPIATGGATDSDSLTVAALAPDDTRVVAESFLFDPPVSPHLAARMAGRPVEEATILETFDTHRLRNPLIIEGIGGLLVPLDDSGWLLVDLLQTLALPLVVVASTRVGTINHTLMTLEAARRRNLEVAGVVLTGPPDEAGNREEIERFGEVDVVDVVPPLEPVDRASVAGAAGDFDRAGKLRAHLVPSSRRETAS